MAVLTPKQLVERLHRSIERDRTGIWLLPIEQLADAPNLAARLHCDTINAVEYWLQSLNPTARYAGVNSTSLQNFLYKICHESDTSSLVTLIHCDLLLCALPYQEQLDTLDYFVNKIPRPKRAAILVLPDTEQLRTTLRNMLQDCERKERLATGSDVTIGG
jgi:hypothetical protein